MSVAGVVRSDSAEDSELANENADGTNPAGIFLP